MKKFKIGNRSIGENEPPLIVAEIGINHNGSLDLAIKITDAAISAGCEVIKHQTHILDDEMIDDAKKIIPGNAKKSIYEIMKKCSLNEQQEFKLMQYVKSKKLIFISSAFSRAAANRLQKFDIPAFKIGSGECNNYPLISHIAKFKKPIILSTGMNSISSIKKSVNILRKHKINFALLHCTNVYPTPPELVRLNCLKILKHNFPDGVIGLSDHTKSNHTSFASIALGAKIIERHFVDKKSRKGPDIICSMDKEELKDLINGSKIIFEALKYGKKDIVKEEIVTKKFAFASVVTIKDIKSGEKLSKKNIWVKRPGTGDFTAADYEKLLGKKITKDVKNGDLVSFKHFK